MLTPTKNKCVEILKRGIHVIFPMQATDRPETKETPIWVDYRDAKAALVDALFTMTPRSKRIKLAERVQELQKELVSAGFVYVKVKTVEELLNELTASNF